jgi:phosphate/sulfate permease
MTTAGGFALIVFAFIIPPIVLLLRSSIPSRRVWIITFPVVTVSTYLGIFLGPVIFESMLWKPHWPSASGHLIMLVCSAVFALWMAATLFVVKRKSEREEVKRRQKIQQAIEKITVDGVVEGPKGPRAAHRQWDVGTGRGTPRETKGPDARGPYGHPAP